MLFYTIGQGSVFLWMALAGMMIGVLYDGFRLLRYLLRAGAALTLILDLLWGVCGGVVLAVMLVIANRGEMRAYVLAAVLVGFGLYALAASRLMVALGSWLVARLRRIGQGRVCRRILK